MNGKNDQQEVTFRDSWARKFDACLYSCKLLNRPMHANDNGEQYKTKIVQKFKHARPQKCIRKWASVEPERLPGAT